MRAYVHMTENKIEEERKKKEKGWNTRVSREERRSAMIAMEDKGK